MRSVSWRWRTTSITFRRTMPCRLSGNPRWPSFLNCARRWPTWVAGFLPATFANSIMLLTRSTRTQRQLCGSSVPKEVCKFQRVVLDRPALAIFAAQVIVGLRQIGNAHVRAVVGDFSSRFQSHDAEQHHFSEPGRVFERARRFGFAFGCVHPIYFVCFAGNARQFLCGLAKGIVERLGKQSWMRAVGFVQQLASAADEQ